MPCSTAGTGGAGRCPWGLADPGGPREGPPDCDLGGVAQQGANVAGSPGEGGSGLHHGRGGQQLTPPGPAHRTHPLAHRRRSPSPHTIGGAGDSRARRRWSQAMGRRGWGRTSDAGQPPSRTGPPDPERTTHPPAVWRGGGASAASSRGVGGDNERADGVARGPQTSLGVGALP